MTLNRVLTGLMALSISGLTLAAKPASKPSVPRTVAAEPVQQQAAAPAPRLNPIANAINKRGGLDCTAQANQIGNFLMNGKEFGGTLFVSPEAPNQHILSTSLELQAPNNMQYAAMTFAPGQYPGKCSATYETVTYWNNSCRDVAIKLYPNYSQARALHKQISTLDGGQSVRVFLMSAGQGCVAIKKEMAF